MLIGQTYAKDAGRSCSDMPNYCDYAPRLRAEELALSRARKPKLGRSRFIQRRLNQTPPRLAITRVNLPQGLIDA
jgi:hypothetical protein